VGKPHIEADRKDAARRAHGLLHNRPSESWAIIDVETTSLYGVVVEVGVIDPQGNTLFYSLVNPECPVSPEAREKHGITDEELSVAPRLPGIWDDLRNALKGRDVLVAFNADFDKARLAQSAQRYNLPHLTQKWGCAMQLYSQFKGNWSTRYGSYTWVPLNGGHRAIGDCIACLERLKEMAAAHMGEGAGQSGAQV